MFQNTLQVSELLNKIPEASTYAVAYQHVKKANSLLPSIPLADRRRLESQVLSQSFYSRKPEIQRLIEGVQKIVQWSLQPGSREKTQELLHSLRKKRKERVARQEVVKPDGMCFRCSQVLKKNYQGNKDGEFTHTAFYPNFSLSCPDCKLNQRANCFADFCPCNGNGVILSSTHPSIHYFGVHLHFEDEKPVLVPVQRDTIVATRVNTVVERLRKRGVIN